MATYYYKAKDKAAGTLTGQLQAENQEQALEMIHQQGLIPVMISTSPEETRAKQDHSEEPRKSVEKKGPPLTQIKECWVKNKELYLFSRQLASLIRAGVSILQALRMLSEQTQNVPFRGVLVRIHNSIRDGKRFSDCLAEYPQIFDPFYVAMVRVGEEGGNLREILQQLAGHLQSQGEILSKVRSALAYPVLMIVVGVGTVFFILTFVMPRITQMFSSLQQTLPLPTVILMGISGFLEKFWVWVAIFILTLILLIKSWARTERGQLVLSQMKLDIPLVREFILKAELARFCRTLEALLKSGVPLLRGLSIAVPTLSNAVIKGQLSSCRKGVESGMRLTDSLREIRLIPGMMINLIHIGEESGSMENALKEVADIYEQETAETIKVVTTLLEPLMILAVGLVIGMIVLAMLLPIFQMDILAQ